jgi:oxalate decarboxylase/phosphoglucose isomerase-like protein (cupin superfamily)
MFFGGTGRAVVGDQEFETGPGSVVYTPPDTYHQFFNTGPEPVKLFWSYSPPGAERAEGPSPASSRTARVRVCTLHSSLAWTHW